MFAGRVDAAQKLLSKLKQFEQSTDTCVLGLLRGGIVTAKVISEFLLLPIQPLIVKKIGAPGNSELAIGAMVGRKNVYWNSDLVKKLRISKKQKNYLVDSKMAEIKILEKQLQIPEFKYFKNVILADDGVATGATVIASQEFLRKSKVNKIYLATPIIASDTLRDIKRYFDGLFYLEKPKDFYAVSEFYKNFPQVTNSEVSSILHS